MTAYRRRATGTAMPAGMNYLSDLIIRPGIEKQFGPLLLYRGNMNRGHAHRLWNFALLMMASECETLSDGYKALNNPAFSQLCGPPKAPGKFHMWNFFGRLADNPAVTKNVEGLTEYVKMIGAGSCGLIRVDRFSDRINVPEWRKSTHEDGGQDYRDRERGVPKSAQLFYPFIAHNHKKPDDGKDLVLLVNEAVPHYWPEQVRADVCQDIIVGILSGEIKREAAKEHVQKYIRKHFKDHPMLWEGNMVKVSMDKPLSAETDLSLHDVVSAWEWS